MEEQIRKLATFLTHVICQGRYVTFNWTKSIFDIDINDLPETELLLGTSQAHGSQKSTEISEYLVIIY